MDHHQGAGTLPIQPKPKAQPIPIEASLIVTPDRRHSSLVRRWPKGSCIDCKLCPPGNCSASGDVCHLVIEGEIGPDKAAMYSVAPRDGFGLRLVGNN